jgi:hypothetical protein
MYLEHVELSGFPRFEQLVGWIWRFPKTRP